MATPIALAWGSVSVTGNYRENNEDRCFVEPQGRFFLVADGMGGQSAGEKASELAIDLVKERLAKFDFEKADAARATAAIDAAVGHANTEIMALGELEARYRSMGTTIAYVVHGKPGLIVGNVGDSRVYRLRNGQLDRLTKDHSLTQALVDAGTISPEEALTHRYKNVLYKYLGAKEGSQGTEARVIPPHSGDRYLICSDGVTDGLSDSSLVPLLAADGNPQQMAERIVEAALGGGSRDNVTCVVIHVR
ncbi:Serine/threonine phosphatase stp [Caulifigura coniformis]|uniref:Serine/threonine phosphatase stp n=1 Tax=Caulifigura coniformis TaxID=2527983 RepID=A0A517SFD1_9PLAN|nr:protein phosphatase 2C domain-containing protein [Caulifigura coniformis]QDT54818.1 Serine/threonine phosphatase stp [Caulifigura coniformis]